MIDSLFVQRERAYNKVLRCISTSVHQEQLDVSSNLLERYCFIYPEDESGYERLKFHLQVKRQQLSYTDEPS